jgi:hypothetical protein
MKELQTKPWFDHGLKVGVTLITFFFSHFSLVFFFFFGRARRVFAQTLPALGGAAGACAFDTVYPAHANNGGTAATVARTNVRAQQRRSRRSHRHGTGVC